MKFILTLALLATANAITLSKGAEPGYGNEQDRTLQAGRAEAAAVVAA